ncbi:hypothetical protein RSAG8_00034, partial [Rhizoctonia solani AG-8 WAC10335]
MTRRATHEIKEAAGIHLPVVHAYQRRKLLLKGNRRYTHVFFTHLMTYYEQRTRNRKECPVVQTNRTTPKISMALLYHTIVPQKFHLKAPGYLVGLSETVFQP